MQNVLLTIHLIACVALVIAVMLQRSEGGALGMSGGGTGGLISGRGAASALVRATMFLAAVFFITSISMTWLNNQQAQKPGVLDQPASTNPFSTTSPATPAPAAPAPATATAPAPAQPATPDPLAPAATAPAITAPATTQPTAPAPAPESGGSNN